MFARLDEDRQHRLTELMGSWSVARIATEMDADDRADFFSILPPSVHEPLLEELEKVDPEAAEDVEELVRWPDASAGGLMTTDYISVSADLRLADAINEIRSNAKAAETVESIYVVDSAHRLLGMLTLRQLLLSKPDDRVADVMISNVISVLPELDQEEAAKILAKYDLHTLPVADQNGKMLGVITSDDIIDVVVEEQAEDAEKFGGMEALDAPYLQTSFWSMIKKRGGWLAVLFLGEMITASAMTSYEHDVAARGRARPVRPAHHLERRQFRFAGVDAHHSRDGPRRGQASRLVAHRRTRAPCGDRARVGARTDRRGAHRLVAGDVQRLRRALLANRRDRRHQPGRSRRLGNHFRFDAALRPAPPRPRPGERIGSVRRDARRRPRARDLLRDRPPLARREPLVRA